MKGKYLCVGLLLILTSCGWGRNKLQPAFITGAYVSTSARSEVISDTLFIHASGLVRCFRITRKTAYRGAARKPAKVKIENFTGVYDKLTGIMDCGETGDFLFFDAQNTNGVQTIRGAYKKIEY